MPKAGKVFFSIFFLSVTFSFSQVQDSLKAWKTGGAGTLNFSQTSFTNWAQGGENALTATGIINLFANLTKGNSSWENSLDAAYGFLQTNGDMPKKNEDRFELRTKYGYKTAAHWYFSALADFKSQFAPGYNYPNDSAIISNFMAPAYLLSSIGMDYKPNDDFSFFASPVTGKTTIVNNQGLADAGAYGVEKAKYDTANHKIANGKKIRNEFGAMVSIKYKKEIMKNITLATKADFFSNYFHHPQNIDVNWDLLISMKVNKLISASISATLIYDDDIPVPLYREISGIKTQTGVGPRTQFKEVLAVGVSYKF